MNQKTGKTKKILSLLLAVIMLLSTLPLTVFAATTVASGNCGADGDNITWVLDSNGTLTLTGTGKMKDYYFDYPEWRHTKKDINNIVIGYGITSIGENAFANSSDAEFWGEDYIKIKNITIPNSVTTIGESAFANCRNLSSITFPESVTTINSWAFHNCSGLKSVKIPASVTNFSYFVFAGCTGLTSIMVDVNNKQYDSRQNCNAIIEKSTNSLRAGCRNTIIPNSVTVIDSGAFYGCASKSIEIPNNVEEIRNDAFASCYSLETISIPKSVTKIGESAFDHCSNLKSITILGNIPKIERFTFSGCDSLSSINIPDSVTEIGYCAFMGCDSLTSIVIPENVTSIGSEAFAYSTGLMSITIPKSVTHIAFDAFSACHKDLTLYVESGSYAEEFAKEKDINYKIIGITPLDYLVLSDASYKNFPKNCIGKTIKEAFDEDHMNLWNTYWEETDYKFKDMYSNVSNWTILKQTSNSEETGFSATAFESPTGKIVIAYRGSASLKKYFGEDDSRNDWNEDLAMFFNSDSSSQIKEALDFYNEIYSIAKNANNISITGHSLGGALGDIVSVYSGSYAETFNAAPFLDILFYYGAVNLKYNKYNFIQKFSGTDKFNFYDHVNTKDTSVGANNKERKNIYLHTVQGYLEGAFKYHKLRSFVEKKQNGSTPKLTDCSKMQISSSIWQMDSHQIVVGTSGNDNISVGVGVTINTDDIVAYGGDGNDTIQGTALSDTFVGGKGNDTIIGDSGNDVYYYTNGDGKDTINDTSGNDTIYLYGFNKTDDISFLEKNKDYISVSCNGEEILLILRSREYPDNKQNTINVIVEKGDVEYQTNLKSYLNYKKFDIKKIFWIMCPVTITVKDSNGTSVYTVPNEIGYYSNDYGFFYVYEEEGDIKHKIWLNEKYSMSVSGDADGTMEIYYIDIDSNELYGIENIKVDTSMKTEIIGSDAAKSLNVYYKNDTQLLNFEKQTNKVTINSNPENLSGYPMTYTVKQGNSVNLFAQTINGYIFSGWYVNDELISAESTYALSVEKDINVIAKYEKHEHTTSEIKFQAGATCFDVSIEYTECISCGKILSTTEFVPGHQYDTGKVTTAATCAKEGVKTYTCTVCKATKTESIPMLKQTFTYGDVDADGKITAADARLALRASVGLENYPAGSDKYNACDVDADGKITAADARLILRASVGLEDKKNFGKK